MKKLIALCLVALLFYGCQETCIEQKECSVPATVRDLTGLDGCGWVFELSDGKRLEPERVVFFCGTPPLPKEVTEDPLYNFEWADGKTVYISYLELDAGSICMVGPVVKITCISDRAVNNNE
jgi:hypothetical protein